jgi:hypothetical protein
MQNELAILACASPFDGASAMLVMSAFLSLVLGVLMGVANLVMICVLEHRRQATTRHLLAFLGYFVAGIVIVTGGFEDFKLICGAVIAAAILISVHLAVIIKLLRRTRPSS